MFALASEAIGLADDQTAVCRVCRRIYNRSSLPYLGTVVCQEPNNIDLSQRSVMDSSSSVV